MVHMIYNIAYYVVNLYLRKAPEQFGGFHNADEVDMCSRLTSLPSSHLVLHPELCDIAIDKLVDSYGLENVKNDDKSSISCSIS